MNVSKVVNLLAFVPAKDYALSRRFYADLGFTEEWGGPDACELQRDGFSFILQNFHVEEHSGNFMMSLNVEDADSWWQYIQDAGLKEKYGLGTAKPPALQPWGLRVLYLSDPSGVLWHIADAAERSVVSIAHRGGIVPGVPENTLAAFRRAIQLGAHVIEIDLRTTRDGEIVILHDETVSRTTNGHGKVAKRTWAQLQQLDAGNGERIPSYEQVLQLIAGTGVALLLDIKESPNLNFSKVAQLAEKHHAVQSVIVGPRRVADLRAFQALNPDLKTLGFIKELVDLDPFLQAGVDIIRLWPEWIQENPGVITKLHQLGKPVWVIAGDAPREQLADQDSTP